MKPSCPRKKLIRLNTDEIEHLANNLDELPDVSEDGYDSDLDKSFVCPSTDEESDVLSESSFLIGTPLHQQKRKRKKIQIDLLEEPLIVPSPSTKKQKKAKTKSSSLENHEPVPGPSGINNLNMTPDFTQNDGDSGSEDSDASFEGYYDNIDSNETGMNEVQAVEAIIPEVNLEGIKWKDSVTDFQPRLQYPKERRGIVQLANVDNPLTIFSTFFSPEILEHIATCTNLRIKIDHKSNPKKSKNASYKETTASEILVFLGITVIMGYNKVPDLHCYWMKSPSMGNQLIKQSMARDRFCYLHAHLYLNPPEKPANASKTYYLDFILSKLNAKFRAAYTDSSYQSVDEGMVGFKGRSVMKQYMPMKPTKRGIKLWQRNYSLTGYTYDLSVYSGRADPNGSGGKEKESLGERVVLSLAKTIRNKDTLIACDRFFSSPILFARSPVPLVGTYRTSRKYTPKELTTPKLKKNDCEFAANQEHGLLCTRWQDNNDVYVMSNCHKSEIDKTTRKQRDGTKQEVFCPKMILDYNAWMCGTDRCDQMASLYNYGRKSNKWWKKTFFRLFRISLINTWVIWKQIESKEKIPFFHFLDELASHMIERGLYQRPKKAIRLAGRPSKAEATLYRPQGEHYPVASNQRKRCIRCSKRKIERRVKIICHECNQAICLECFLPYHREEKRKNGILNDSQEEGSSSSSDNQTPQQRTSNLQDMSQKLNVTPDITLGLIEIVKMQAKATLVSSKQS